MGGRGRGKKKQKKKNKIVIVSNLNKYSGKIKILLFFNTKLARKNDRRHLFSLVTW